MSVGTVFGVCCMCIEEKTLGKVLDQHNRFYQKFKDTQSAKSHTLTDSNKTNSQNREPVCFIMEKEQLSW